MKKQNRVLVVEDDIDIVNLLEIHLNDLNCQLTKAFDGDDGNRLALSESFDLIILDLMLPGMDGFSICKNIRANNIKTPVLMLTAKSEEIDKVLGLEIGADDYLTKPFGLREFVARVKALFRRSQANVVQDDTEKEKVLSFGRLKIDIENRKVTVAESRIELSPKEFDLLTLLATKPGKCFTRSRILNLVWGYEFNGYEHTVNSHINRLRTKIEPDISNPQYILTNWGVGYRFNEENQMAHE